ncbi:hypothetical protein HCN44_000024 [Aphidius gifuensis]|uniref:Uncharacterized protein n=1 Tax=Aphidius gifuensis TaxID=684658 RepID=A0A834XS02_APHGI|nr:hypothetical protein HCN44_000024 [Aphidius gifuensis]
MATGTGDLPSTLPNDRNLTIQLPHHQESIPQPSQILNEINIYPETPPPTYDQALKYLPGVQQPFPPIPVINNNVQQSTAVNPPVPYALAHINNGQTTSMNCALVQEPPKPSNRIGKYYLSCFIILETE